jgi:lipopolysaccharide export system protein LptA
MPHHHPPLFRWPSWALLLLACTLSLPALAEKADRDQPMQIEADRMRHDEARLLTEFTGRVLATKGTLVLRAARMEVQQDAQGRQVAKLWAAPQERVFFRQKREGLNEYTEGEAETLVYDTQADVITLSQRAELRVLRGAVVADQLLGHTIVFNNRTEVMTVDGQAPGTASSGERRVRATLTPRSNTAAPPSSPVAPALRNSPALTSPQKP